MLRGVPQISLKVGTTTVTESRTVKNLGLVMDRHMTFEPHIDQLTAKSAGHVNRPDARSTSRTTLRAATNCGRSGDVLNQGIVYQCTERVE